MDFPQHNPLKKKKKKKMVLTFGVDKLAYGSRSEGRQKRFRDELQVSTKKLGIQSLSHATDRYKQGRLFHTGANTSERKGMGYFRASD